MPLRRQGMQTRFEEKEGQCFLQTTMHIIYVHKFFLKSSLLKEGRKGGVGDSLKLIFFKGNF